MIESWTHTELRGRFDADRLACIVVELDGAGQGLGAWVVNESPFVLPLENLPVAIDITARLRTPDGGELARETRRFPAPAHDFSACVLPPAVVLPFHDGDAEQFVAILDLIDLHPPGRDCRFDILYQKTPTDLAALPAWVRDRLRRFAGTHSARRICANVRGGGPYPSTPNSLFRCYVREIADVREKFVFWMETDCLPLQANWLLAVEAAVDHWPHDPIVGYLMPPGRTRTHGSCVPAHYIGCSAYRPPIRDLVDWDRFDDLGRCPAGGFDVQISLDVMPVRRRAGFIIGDLNFQPGADQVLHRYGNVPLFHGYKRATAVRDLLQWRRRAANPPPPPTPSMQAGPQLLRVALRERWARWRTEFADCPRYLYGAGRHTRWLLDRVIDADHGLTGIVDDAPGAPLAGVPVLPPADLPPGRCLVVTSTDRPELAATLAARARDHLGPDGVCRDLYDGFPVGPFEKDDAQPPAPAPDVLVPPAPTPALVTWFITNRCNLRCAHCFEPGGKRDENVLTAAEAREFFASFPRRFSLVLTGGEPTLVADLEPRLLALAETAPVASLTLCSNGTRPDALAAFAEAWRAAAPDRPLSIQVSVDGLPALHDRIRGVPGSFDLALTSLRRLGTVPGVRAIAKTVVSTVNRDAILPLVDFLRAEGIEHGVTLVRGNSFSLFGAGEAAADYDPSEDVGLDAAAAAAVFAAIEDHCPDFFSPAARRQWQYSIATLRHGRRVIRCGAGHTDMVLHADGSVAICEPLKAVANVCDHGLDIQRLWSSPALDAARRESRACACIHGCNLLAAILRNEPIEAHPEVPA